MGGEVLYPDKANGLIVVYSYEDYDGLVLWDSTCILDIEMDDSFTARFTDIEIADRLAKETV